MPTKYKYSRWEQMMVFLLRYCERGNDFVAPTECTQIGIAKALNITRPHAALEVKRLLEKKYAEKSLKHTPSHRTKLLTYNLTFEGRNLAVQIKRKMDEDGKTLEDIINERPKKNISAYVSYHELFKKFTDLEKRLDTLERSSR